MMVTLERAVIEAVRIVAARETTCEQIGIEYLPNRGAFAIAGTAYLIRRDSGR
jgi:hypothetical protein